MKVEVPIFQGGEAAGAYRQALSQARQSALKLKEAQRKAVQEVQDAHGKFRRSLRRTEKLADALGAADEGAQLSLQEYRSNLVSNLEVLTSLETLEEARRDLIHAHYETKRLYWNFKAAAGDIPEDSG